MSEELVPVPPKVFSLTALQGAHLLVIPPEWYTPQGLGRWATTCDLKDPAQKKLVQKALNGDPEKAAVWINRTIQATHLTFTPWSKVDEQGVEVIMPMTIIHGVDGEMCAIFTDKILKSLRIICSLEREPPWVPPLPLKLEQKPCAGGERHFFRFIVDEEAQAKAKVKK